MIANYHTHTYRCKHADGSDEDYVEAAIAAGFEEIGFTDHSPWPLHPFEKARIRMDESELKNYVDSISDLKKKYADQINIYLGLEVEYFEDRQDWLRGIVEEYALDYLVFGNHFYHYDTSERYFGHYQDQKHLLDHYLECALKGLDTGMYKILAHPELFMRSYPVWDQKCDELAHQICQKAKERNVYLEYNLGGARSQRIWSGGYPDLNFWKIVAEYQCLSVIGIDAHSPQNFYDQELFESSEKILRDLGVNLKDRIQIKEDS